MDRKPDPVEGTDPLVIAGLVEPEDPIDAAMEMAAAIEEFGEPPEGYRYDLSRTEPMPDGRRHPVAVPFTRTLKTGGQRNGGNKAHVPTKKTRARVRLLCFCAWPMEQIAKAIGCSVETLQRHYADDIEIGPALEKARILERYKRVATGEPWVDMKGKWHQGPPEPKMLERLATNAGLPIAPKKIELTGADNGPIQISAVEMLRRQISGLNVQPPPALPAHGDTAPPAERDVAGGETPAPDA